MVTQRGVPGPNVSNCRSYRDRDTAAAAACIIGLHVAGVHVLMWRTLTLTTLGLNLVLYVWSSAAFVTEDKVFM